MEIFSGRYLILSNILNFGLFWKILRQLIILGKILWKYLKKLKKFLCSFSNFKGHQIFFSSSFKDSSIEFQNSCLFSQFSCTIFIYTALKHYFVAEHYNCTSSNAASHYFTRYVVAAEAELSCAVVDMWQKFQFMLDLFPNSVQTKLVICP